MPYKYSIRYRPGKHNTAADALSRQNCAAVENIEQPQDIKPDTGISDLVKLHNDACHPGVVRFWHLVRARNLPHSLESVKNVVKTCPTCLEIKPNFMHTPPTPLLIKTF